MLLVILLCALDASNWRCVELLCAAVCILCTALLLYHHHIRSLYQRHAAAVTGLLAGACAHEQACARVRMLYQRFVPALYMPQLCVLYPIILRAIACSPVLLANHTHMARTHAQLNSSWQSRADAPATVPAAPSIHTINQP